MCIYYPNQIERIQARTLAKSCQVYIPNDIDNILIYRQNMTVLGFLAWQQILDEISLHAIAVSPVSRKQGIATKLMQHALSVWKETGAYKIFLEVNINNTIAIMLYKNNGFHSIGQRKNYYSTTNGLEDAIIMYKELI